MSTSTPRIVEVYLEVPAFRESQKLEPPKGSGSTPGARVTRRILLQVLTGGASVAEVTYDPVRSSTVVRRKDVIEQVILSMMVRNLDVCFLN